MPSKPHQARTALPPNDDELKGLSSDGLPGFDQGAAGNRDLFALLIPVFDLGHHEGHFAATAAFAFIYIGNPCRSGEEITDQDWFMQFEFLLAMQNPAQVEMNG